MILPPLRMLFGRRSHRLAVAVGAVALIVGMLACWVLSVGGVQASEGQRRDARTPTLKSVGAGLHYAELLTPFGARTIRRIILAADAGVGGPVPPGLERLPAAGTVAVSPALAHLLRNDERVRKWFPVPVSGIVTRPGLSDPAELLAYVVVEPSQLHGAPVVQAFGAAQGPNPYAPRMRWYQLAGFLMFVLVPGALCLVASAGVDLERRQRRHSALRSCGAPGWWSMGFGAVEAGIPALFGGAVAALLASPVAGRAKVVPLIGRRFFASDVHIGALGWSVTAALGVLATASSVAVERRSQMRRRARSLGWIRWSAAAALVSLALLLVASRASLGTRRLLLIPALVTYTVGLGPAAALIARRAFARVLVLGLVAGLVARRSLARSPGRLGRPMALCGVAVLAVIVSIPIIRNGDPGVKWSDRTGPTILVRVEPMVTGASIRAAPAPSAPHAFAVTASKDGSHEAGRALVATCDTARVLTGRQQMSCSPGVLIARGGQVGDVWTIEEAGGQRLRLRTDGSIDVSTGAPVPIDVDIVITDPQWTYLSNSTPVSAAWVRIPATREDVDTMTAWTVSHGAAHQLDVPYAEIPVPSRLGLWIALGVLITSSLGSLALLLSAAVSRQSRDDLLALTLSGCSRVQVAGARALAQFLIGVVAVALGVLGGYAVNLSAVAGGLPPAKPVTLFLVAGAGVAAAATTAALGGLTAVLGKIAKKD